MSEHMFVQRERVILHADVDAFYAAVAQRDDARLRGRPVAVGSWVVMAASYEARAFGVRGGMATAQARRLCPGLVVVDPSWPAYAQASRAIFAIFATATPEVQAGSMEEAFLDVTGAERPPVDIAHALRREVRQQVGLPLSVGVARSRVLAKMASRAAKPDNVRVVAPGDEARFLRPLPVEQVWGIGPATAAKLRARGVLTMGDAASLEESELVAIAGKAAGRYVHGIAHNRELRPVRRRPRRGSFGAQRALRRGRHPPDELARALDELVTRVTQRMQRKRLAGRTVILRLRFADYTRATRSHTVARPTADPEVIGRLCRALLRAAMPEIERRGVTLVGLTVANLDDGAVADQLALPLNLRPL